MKLVKISGSTKGEYLTSSDFIKFELIDWDGVAHPVTPDMVVQFESGSIKTGSHGEYVTGGVASIPPYNDKPELRTWTKTLLIPDNYVGYKIYADCDDCNELEREFSGSYRNMIMSGTFDGEPTPVDPRPR